MKKRFLLKSLNRHVNSKEITLLLGARQTGKTTLLKQLEEQLNNQNMETAFFNLDNKTFLESFNKHPKNIFKFIPLPNNNRIVVFIDEIQYLDDPSNFLKLLYDEYANNLKLIVSGSSAFYIDQKFKDSLAGRKRIFYLPTMGFREFLSFRGYDNLMPYVHSDNLPKLYLSELQALLSEYLIFGGYPRVVLSTSTAEKKEILKELATSYVKKDIKEASIQHTNKYMIILKMIAKQIGCLLNLNTICKTVKTQNVTLESYLHVMQKSFHIALVKPFYRNKIVELRKMKKVYFQDLGLRNYFSNNFQPIPLRDDKGNLLENYVFRLFAEHFDSDEEIKYWRTQKKQEVDFIIQERYAYEIKFSEDLFKLYKYQFFTKNYPKIPLKLLHFENILEFNPAIIS